MRERERKRKIVLTCEWISVICSAKQCHTFIINYIWFACKVFFVHVVAGLSITYEVKQIITKKILIQIYNNKYCDHSPAFVYLIPADYSVRLRIYWPLRCIVCVSDRKCWQEHITILYYVHSHLNSNWTNQTKRNQNKTKTKIV